MIAEKVYKTSLSNGLNILVLPRHHIPKVSMQLWYNVGSKDERSGEKGLAHFIEHMIFKGTKSLTESDINMIVHKLSGYCNAFTSYDYTGYLFDIPSQHWQEVLPIMADSMRNCTFKEELLNSELKAVIQELKMYNDDFTSSLVEAMIAQIFFDHPYHHPIIGYKQDLWSLKRDALVRFYEHHYIPNNASLVIVGDVNPQEVHQETEKAFGHIPAQLDYRKEEFYHSSNLMSQQVTLYRDVQQPVLLLGWVIPGIKQGLDYVFDVMSWIIAAGKGSRLTKKLVDDLEWVTEIESFTYDLFDHAVFFIHIEPKPEIDVEKIIKLIQEELRDLATNEVSDQELHRARKKTEFDFLSLMENNQKQAYLLGKYFTAMGDENYLQSYTSFPLAGLKDAIKMIAKDYLRPAVMYQGQVIALPSNEQEYWLKQQEQSDAEDARVLGGKLRETEVEEAAHAHTIQVKAPKAFDYLKPTTVVLDNGLKLLFCNNPELPKIELLLDFKMKHYYDPEELQGLSLMTADLLQEGTTKHDSHEFACLIESMGMELNTFPGHIALSMLSCDFERGLEIINELLHDATCTTEAVEKIRKQMFAEIKSFWDNPSQFAGQLLRQYVYKNHPYHQSVMGTLETVARITQQDIKNYYHKAYSPQEARLVVVGDLAAYNVPELIKKHLGHWCGEQIPTIQFPELQPIISTIIEHPINRDQTVLCYGGLSVDRKHPDFDALLLFDQIFTGGVLGSMSSRLFALRERSGLFYTIGGSLLAGVDVQPGMVYVKTIVSNDRLQEADRQIRALIDRAAQDFTDQELLEAQQALINSFVDHFATSKQATSTFLFLDKFGFSFDYFDQRPQQLRAVTREQIQQVVQKYLNTKRLINVRVGRV